MFANYKYVADDGTSYLIAVLTTIAAALGMDSNVSGLNPLPSSIQPRFVVGLGTISGAAVVLPMPVQTSQTAVALLGSTVTISGVNYVVKEYRGESNLGAGLPPAFVGPPGPPGSAGPAFPFISDPVAVTTGVLYPIPHGLGVTPRILTAVFVCTSASHNYAVGDVVNFYSVRQIGDNYANNLQADATNVYVSLINDTLYVWDFDVADLVVMDLSKFKVIVAASP
jgi:hypothetical protein